MRQALVLSVLLVVGPALAQGTWIPKTGECPWYDRVGKYVIGDLPAKYVRDKPVPQQACNEPRKLVLPAEGAEQVTIAIGSRQSAMFADKLGLEPTGDSFELMDASGTKAVMTYDIFVYKNPPRVTEFEGATAGIILLSWEGEYEAIEPPPKGAYTPAERAYPWHDRAKGSKMEWVMVDVPQGIQHGKAVPQQSCTVKNIVLPKAGLPAITIGMSDKDVERLPPALKQQMVDTGSDFNIQAPGGGRKLPYSILIYRNPPKETKFEGFGAGVVLLALKDMSETLGGPTPPTAAPEKGRPRVLETEQEFVAQEWPFEPGERKVKMHIEEPSNGINYNTGMMLVLHNWGGRYNESQYVQWCKTFADRYNVVAASVNYLQSAGAEPKIVGEKPYDHGYLQAMDCLRALYHIQKQLKDAEVMFNPHRCYAMGGSGGGNVALMANKLAPHTFACIVDICGMPGLTDGIAFGAGEFGSHLNAGYSKDPESPAYLTKDMQEIRDPGHREHLQIQCEANPSNKVVIVHGLDDMSCPVAHKITIFRTMVETGFRPDGHFLTPWHVDGTAVKTTGHTGNDRQKVVERFADAYMMEDGKLALETPGKNDFERAEEVVFPTSGGRFVVDYSAGPPTIGFGQQD